MCEFSVYPKQNKHSWLSWHPAIQATPPPHRYLQISVFQMNYTQGEMTNSQSDERFNMWESASKMGFISWMWRGFWSHLNGGSAIPSPPVVMQWSSSAQNRARCIKTRRTCRDGVQQQGGHRREVTAAHQPRTKRSPPQTATCGPRRKECVGNFFYFPASFWGARLKTLADRRSSFARPYPRIWTYAQPPCRTVCLGMIWRPLLCSCERRFYSRRRRSWTKKRLSENWPQSWLGVRVRAAPTSGTRGREAGGKKLGPKTQWGMCRGALLTLWRNYHRLYSHWSRD